MKKYFATVSIGYNVKRGRPQFMPNDEVPESHPNFSAMLASGQVSEKKQDETEKTLVERPRVVPIYPIKQDISTAKNADSKENKATRVLAQSLSSVTVDEQDKIDAEKQKAAYDLNNKKNETKAVVGEKKTTAPVQADSNHASASTDADAVKEDNAKADDAGVKTAAKKVEEEGAGAEEDTTETEENEDGGNDSTEENKESSTEKTTSTKRKNAK